MPSDSMSRRAALRLGAAALLLAVGMLAFAACDVAGEPLATPTVTLTGPTIEASATILIESSENLPQYGGVSNPTIAALPSRGGLPPVSVGTPAANGSQGVEVVASDGTPLSGDLYELGADRRPGILLLSSDRTAWGLFPLNLQNAGYTVLAMNLRPGSTTDDLKVTLDALMDVGTVDPSRLAVIGAGLGADAALVGCAGDLRCDTVVLLSPLSRDTLLTVIGQYGARPLFLAASDDDAESFPAASALASAATGPVQFLHQANTGRGEQMLDMAPDLSQAIIDWMGQYLAG